MVHLARRRFDRAEEHLERARALTPGEPAVLRSLAQLYRLRGQGERVLPTLEAALALAPADAETLVAIGEHHLQRGDLAKAEEMARTVLAESAEDQDALVLMGHVWLARGHIQEAWSHARSALAINPSDSGALYLLCAVKARSNRFLGLWWRWNAWVNVLGDGKQVAVLLGVYLAYRVATQVSGDLGEPALASALSTFWLAFIIYTWVSPAIFRRMLTRALRAVRLRPDF